MDQNEKKRVVPETIDGGVAGEDLDCREIRNVVLNKGLAVVDGDGNASAVGAPFVVTIPEIGEGEIFNPLSLPWMPQTIQIPNLTLRKRSKDWINKS